MAANNQQLRNPVQLLDQENNTYYTASASPYLQGAEIVQFSQLLNFANLKVRSNTDFVTALSGSSSGWQATGEGYQSFDDSHSPENFGSSRQKSYASLFVPNRFSTYVSHYSEQRDLGQVNTYDDGNAFIEPDEVNDPIVVITKHPDTLNVPTNLVQVCGSPASFDGVIEALDIRKVLDRSSIDLPFVIRGLKGDLPVTTDNSKSSEFSDTFDIRQQKEGKATAPFLDYVNAFGNANFLLDQPGAFSDAIENLSSFTDAEKIEGAYPPNTIDSTIRDLLLSGVVSGTSQVKPPDTDYFPTYLVAARHGFVFSQNDNYGYDSIAFGGLKK